jgi:hypothetical protein
VGRVPHVGRRETRVMGKVVRVDGRQVDGIKLGFYKCCDSVWIGTEQVNAVTSLYGP